MGTGRGGTSRARSSTWAGGGTTEMNPHGHVADPHGTPANNVAANGHAVDANVNANGEHSQDDHNANSTGEEDEELKDDEASNEPEINCDEFRVPPSILVARRAANEAYWAFDKALNVAERKVGEALDAAIVRGA